jgi:N6-L-threonylcarbamoyladenine synthase
VSVLLAFDTATDHVALAIGRIEADRSPEVVLERDFEAPRASLSRLLPEVQEALSRAGCSKSDISGVVVGRGPGSFTGVRIGVATAKGLAHALGVPLWGVGTLDAIAWRHAEHEGLLGVVGDAMRGEVYPALFDISGGTVVRREEDRVLKPEDAVAEWERLDPSPDLLAGDGLDRYEPLFADAFGAEAIAPRHCWAPSGRSLLVAFADARARDVAGDGDPGALLPIYTRLSDAEEAEVAREKRT